MKADRETYDQEAERALAVHKDRLDERYQGDDIQPITNEEDDGCWVDVIHIEEPPKVDPVDPSLSLGNNCTPDILALNAAISDYTGEQAEALTLIAKFLHNAESEFIMAGYAGTGKSTIVENIYRYVREYKKYPVISSITHRALQVIREKLTFIPDDVFQTIHSMLYGAPDDKMKFSIGSPKVQPKRLTIIDEASMIPQDILDDIRRACRYGKIIFIGDSYQLRPVGDDQKLLAKPNVQLTQVVRHESGILELATAIRNKRKIIIPKGKLDKVYRFTKDPVEIYLNKRENTDSIIIITATNKERVNYNQRIRQALFGMLGCRNDLVPKESLISISNNDWFTNGSVFSVKEILSEEGVAQAEIKLMGKKDDGGNPRTSIEDYHRFKIVDDQNRTIELFLFPITKQPSIYNAQIVELNHQGEDHYRQTNKRVALATYGYAISCHKAQGGQWERVIIDQTYFKTDPRWQYTAITRALKYVYLHMKPYGKKTRTSVKKIKEWAQCVSRLMLGGWL